MIKKLLLATMLFLMVAVTGCSGGGSSQSQDITLMLDWVPNTNHTGLYVALDKGWYKEEGLNVSIIQPTEGGATQLVATGKAQFGVSYQEDVTQARASGVPVVSVAAVIQHNTSGFASRKESGITRPRNMEGKRYGGWGSPTEEAVLKAAMESDGGDFSKVKIFNTGTSDFFTSIGRDVDFAWIYYGWTGIEAEQRGIGLNYLELRRLDPALDYYTPVLIAGEKLIKENPGLVEKFVRASARGYELAIKNPAEAAGILHKHAPELDAGLILASQKYLSPRYQDDAERWGVQKREVWDNYAGWMYERNLLTEQIDADKAFTNDFLPE
jgi:ABC-type nitrate/sulfonate/bicarbonate transport system substrate-binding protein